MSRKCDICGKSPMFGSKISHAHNVTNRKFNVNLRKVKAVVNGSTKRINVCTRCIRSGWVQKPAKVKYVRPVEETKVESTVTIQESQQEPQSTPTTENG